VKIAYLVTDPTIRLDVPSGPASHINGTISGFREHGVIAKPFLESKYFLNTVEKMNVGVQQIDKKNKHKTGNVFRLWARDVRRFIRSYNLCPEITEEIINFQPDVIFERSWLFSLAGGRLARQMGIPHFLETSGCAAELTRDAYGISSVKLANMIERIKLNRAELAVVESKAAVDRVGEKFRLNVNVVAKPLGFEIPKDTENVASVLREEKLFCKKHKALVAFVGTFRTYQGVDLLMEVITKLNTERSEIGFLLIGGGGNQEECVSLLEKRRLKNIYFTGLVPSADVNAHLSLCDIGIVPDCEEHMSPIKTLQYGACGLPVIVPDYFAFDHFIKEGDVGRRFHPKDIESMSNVICSLVEDMPETIQMGGRMKEQVLSDYSWKEVVSDVVCSAREITELATIQDI